MVSARRLLGPREEGADHDHIGAGGQGLGQVPEYLMPPSAMRGMPYCFATAEQSLMAVICGTPIPATTRVVQMEPGPMPTLMASTPAVIELHGCIRRGDVAGDQVDVREGRLEVPDGVDYPLGRGRGPYR